MLTVTNKTPTMSSDEIALLTGKQKKIIHRDIETQLLVNLYGLKDGTYLHHQQIQGITVVLDNRGYWSCVMLDKYHTDILISGYEVKYRAAIVKRWHELEGKQSVTFAIPQTLSEALLLAGQLAAEKEQALAQIEADKPKVEFAMAVRNLDGNCSIGDFAKVLGIGRNTFFSLLRCDGYLMDNNMPYAKYKRYFDVIENKPHSDKNGKTYPSFTTRVTGVGQVYFEKKYRQHDK